MDATTLVVVGALVASLALGGWIGWERRRQQRVIDAGFEHALQALARRHGLQHHPARWPGRASVSGEWPGGFSLSISASDEFRGEDACASTHIRLGHPDLPQRLPLTTLTPELRQRIRRAVTAGARLEDGAWTMQRDGLVSAPELLEAWILDLADLARQLVLELAATRED